MHVLRTKSGLFEVNDFENYLGFLCGMKATVKAAHAVKINSGDVME